MTNCIKESKAALLLLLLFMLYLPPTASHAEEIDIATPVTYTAALMVVELAAMFALDLEEDVIRSSNFEDTYSNPEPERDDDEFYLNFILHPLMGSETYLRAREGNFGVSGSLAFSMAASVTWEYLIESWTEHPSTQDLLTTTGIGWMVGELRYQIKQYNNLQGNSNFWVDPIWCTLEYLDFSITKGKEGYTPVIGLRFPI